MEAITHTPFVTVVMPVYNAGSSIDASIRSVLAQTYQDWVMICVNDGSTDNSLEILNEYASKDTRIKVVSQTNGGVAAARKTAYQMLETPYAINLDADDEFSDDLLEKCVAQAKRTDADILVPDCHNETAGGQIMYWNKTYGYDENTEMTGLEAFSRTFIPSVMHGYLMWRSNLLKQHACGDNAELLRTFSEDEYYRRVLFLNASKVCFCGGYYIYRYNTESITKRFSFSQLGYLVTCRQMVDLENDYDIPKKVSDIVKEYYHRVIVSLQIKLFAFGKERFNKKQYRQFQAKLKEAYKDSLRYRDSIYYADKSRPALYRFASLSCFPVFYLTSYLMSKKKF